MSLSVLLVEDDQELCFELAAYLDRAGFCVRSAVTLAAAEAALTEAADLLVLDINLPDGSGLDLCRRLRHGRGRGMGIVMCTARDERNLRIASLKDGADAYLVKPVDPEELEATLLSVYRRVRAEPLSLLNVSQPLPWRLDVVRHLLTAPNAVGVLLSASEVLVMQTLFGSDGRFASREELIGRLDGAADTGSAHRLEALISRLRRKVADKVGLKLPLISAYGRGYEFAAHIQLVG
jgi:DNA-binding response OmpR family regulator